MCGQRLLFVEDEGKCADLDHPFMLAVLSQGYSVDMNDRQLVLIEEVTSICRSLKIDCWLRGGWAMDFFLHQVTREHDDIDMYAWSRDGERLAGALRQAKFSEIGKHHPDEQRDFSKQGESLQVALLDLNDRGDPVIAGGPWAGAPWPAGVSQPICGWIGTIECPITNPTAQIEIKQTFPEWRLDLPVYEKHQLDIKRLREGLRLSAPTGKDG
jgi:hypothetical protein